MYTIKTVSAYSFSFSNDAVLKSLVMAEETPLDDYGAGIVGVATWPTCCAQLFILSIRLHSSVVHSALEQLMILEPLLVFDYDSRK